MSSNLSLSILVFLYYIYLIIGNKLDGSFFLCKNCGHEIALVKDVIFQKSPFSLKNWNQSLDTNDNDSQFNKPKNQSIKPDLNVNPILTIQLLKNPQGSTFQLLTFRSAELHLLNETQSIEATWFPNFKWTIGLCPHCLVHLGWYFESTVDKSSFFGVIFDKLMNSNYAESIILEPKLKFY